MSSLLELESDSEEEVVLNNGQLNINLNTQDFQKAQRKSCGHWDIKHIVVGNLIFLLIIGSLAAMILATSSNKVEITSKDHALILISIDGFRHSYLNFRNTHPNIKELMRKGVYSELIPVFTSKTFPNHYSIMTGLYAENHGIISNKFFNPVTNRTFSHSDKSESQKSDWWLGEPFWNVVNKNNKKTASYFWPGSEAEINGLRPTYFMPFDEGTPNEVRVNKVVDWLKMPQDKRPSFITLYFSDVDTQGHLYGPDSEEVKLAINNVDNAIGTLVNKINELKNLDVDIIIVSDHGMTPIIDHIYLDDYIDLQKYKIPDLSSPTTHASIWANESDIPLLLKQLKDVKNIKVSRKQDLPNRFHYQSSIRIAPVQVVPDSGYLISTRTLSHGLIWKLGDHGYDPLSENMTGIFVGHGNSFLNGNRDSFENVEVFNIMAGIMGIKPPLNNGSEPYIDGILKSKM